MTRTPARARSEAPRLAGREDFPEITGPHRHAHTQREKSGRQKPAPALIVPAHHRRRPRTRITHAHRAHITGAPWPRSGTPPPGARKFQPPLPYAPCRQKREKFSPISSAAKPAPRIWPGLRPIPGPHFPQYSPIIETRWRRNHDTYKGNTGALHRLLRRQQERSAALPRDKLPPLPVQDGPQAETGRHRTGSP